MNKYSPDILLALKEALALIYWKKEDLRLFIQASVSHFEVLSVPDWTQTKFEICSRLINYMSLRQNIYQDDLFALIKNVASMSDFSHLDQWESSAAQIPKAEKAVARLRGLCRSHLDDFDKQITIEKNRKSAQERIQKTRDFQQKIEEFKSRFSEITQLTPQKRGYELETFLYDLFSFYDLAPRGSFKITGEQIDGAFTHDNTDYLLEAKWQKSPSTNADISIFAAKIDRKLKNTLGVFISMSGFSPEVIDFNTNVRSSMILIDGYDLMMVLENRFSLPEMIRIKRRHAAETGEIMYRIQV